MKAQKNKALPTLLIVDDDPDILVQLKWALKDQYQIHAAENKKDAVSVIENENIDIVALDISLNTHENSYEGLEILKQIRSYDPGIIVVMITGYDDKKLAIEAIKYGAYDYYLKPLDIHELKIIFQRALYIRNLEKENLHLLIKLRKKKQFQDIISNCIEMKKIFATIQKVAATDATILIMGESGTGKELVAKAIHSIGYNSDQPYVTINCGAIPENLLESELFGHEKGAFTGAYFKKIGKFEDADNGIIFLDEIGDLYPTLQVKLLRFLQEREIERVGGRDQIAINTRIIAATNCDLDEKVANSTFRADLFYRISVITIKLPPLRERGDDVWLLANHFLNKYNKHYNKNCVCFTGNAEEIMKKYDWPGNVRELENKVKRAVIMSNDKYINHNDLEIFGFNEKSNRSKGLKDQVHEVEKKAINNALLNSVGNITRAASLLDVSRATFYDIMKKHQINHYVYKNE